MNFADIAFAILLLAIGFALGRFSALRGHAPADPEAPARAAAQMRTEDRMEAARLIKEGRKIDAIREIRQRTNAGLAEAKAIADHLEANDPASGIG